MNKIEQNIKTPRREFLGSLAATAATLGISAFVSPIDASAAPNPELIKLAASADEWFDQVKGKHRIVFDVPSPHDIFPFAWPRVFIMTNTQTGTPEHELSVVLVLRHSAIGYAMDDKLWSKYKMGEIFEVTDPNTKAPAVRNPFQNVKPGDYPLPISITDLQKSGVMICVCDMAMTVYTGGVAKKMNIDAAECKKEWMSGLLPGIQPVPSGVWALGRAQEKQCGYVFAGA